LLIYLYRTRRQCRAHYQHYYYDRMLVDNMSAGSVSPDELELKRAVVLGAVPVRRCDL